MFAGLPGIGVGTLFYVLAAFWMPLREIPRVVRGTSSAATWRLIALQLVHAIGILVTVVIAERLLLWTLGAGSARPFSPAALISGELTERGDVSIFAAPILASLVLLAAVLMGVEILRLLFSGSQSDRRDNGWLFGRDIRGASALPEGLETLEAKPDR